MGVVQKTLAEGAIAKADPPHDWIRGHLDANRNYMTYSDNAETNRGYIEACNKYTQAKEAVQHAKAMPEFSEDSHAKILSITPGKGVKLLSPSQLAEEKKRSIKEAEDDLVASKEEMKKARPAWLAD